jgi:hypothetical protein
MSIVSKHSPQWGAVWGYRGIGVPGETEYTDADRDDGAGGGYVYFIGPRREGAPVKIGFSEHPEARLRDLQCAHFEELVIHAVIDGCRETELELHKRFERANVRGEWFMRTEEIEAIIASAEEYSGREKKPTDVIDAQVLWCDGEYLVVDRRTQSVFFKSENDAHADQFCSAVNGRPREEVERIRVAIKRRSVLLRRKGQGRAFGM